jgi:dipeptidyl aminopeptidase/acylaminoacyl peptidase
MCAIYNISIFRFWNKAFITAFVLLAVLLTSNCGSKLPLPRKHTQIYNPEFSPDGKRLVFTYCRRQLIVCDLGLYELKTGEIQIFSSPDGESRGGPAFSRDGRYIAFNSFDPHKRWVRRNPGYYSLAIMNADGTKLRKLTDDDAFRIGPTFSPDGNRLIFRGSPRERVSLLTERAFDKRIWVIDLKTGEERILGDKSSLNTSKIFYLPNGRDYLFSDSPHRLKKTDHRSSGERSIWLKTTNSLVPKQIVVTDDLKSIFDFNPDTHLNSYYLSSLIGVSGDGEKIAFLHAVGFTDNGRTKFAIVIADGSSFKVPDISFKSSNGRTTSTIRDGALSLDRKMLALVVHDDDVEIYSLWFVNTDGTGLRKLEIK